MFSVEEGVARLTLNRPDKLNSFNAAMHKEVREALARVASEGGRVLVLSGAGRAFCAGQDLGDRAVAPGGQGLDLVIRSRPTTSRSCWRSGICRCR